MVIKKPKYVTEEYLDKKLDILGNKLKIELFDFMMQLHNKMKHELYEIKDLIVGEIKGYREEHDVHHASHMRINDDLVSHDRRIKKLELKQKH